MSYAPKLRPSKRSAKRNIAGVAFDPAAFLQTVAPGRIISAHKKKGIIFEQGDPADSVIYIKSGKIKVTVICRNPWGGRISG